MSEDIEDSDPIFAEERQHLEENILEGNTKETEMAKPTEIITPVETMETPKTPEEKFIDVEIVMNGVKNWWCAKELKRGKDKKGLDRIHVQPLNKKLKSRWISESKTKKCEHTTPVSTPHGISTVVKRICKEGSNSESAVMGSNQVSMSNLAGDKDGGLLQNIWTGGNGKPEDIQLCLQIGGMPFKLIPWPNKN